MVERIRCSLDGGLVLTDSIVIQTWKVSGPSEEFDVEGELSIAVDVAGKTDQRNNWPGEEWRNVWIRETQGLVSRVNSGEIAVFLLHEGEFFVDFVIDQSQSDPVPTNLMTWRSDLYLTSGRLAIAELGTFIPLLGLDKLPNYGDRLIYREIDLTPGWYTVTFFVPNSIATHHVGRTRVYGTEQHPALSVVLTPTERNNVLVHELFHKDFASE